MTDTDDQLNPLQFKGSWIFFNEGNFMVRRKQMKKMVSDQPVVDIVEAVPPKTYAVFADGKPVNYDTAQSCEQALQHARKAYPTSTQIVVRRVTFHESANYNA